MSDAEQDDRQFVVTGAAAVLRTPSGQEPYLYRGARLAAGSYTADAIEHALANGLIGPAPEEVDHEADRAAAVAAAAEAGGASGSVAQSDVPIDDPSWAHDRIDQFVKDNSLTIEGYAGFRNKGEKVTAITAALKSKAEADAAANQQ